MATAADAQYSRYADDLAFSGDAAFQRTAKRFQIHVAAVAAEEGFKVYHRKTRIMHRGVRQHLAGLIVNEFPNVRRADFERLKAILTNCIRTGPALQNHSGHENFEAHLLGRIAFVESVNPTRGRKLRALFEQILW